MVDRFFVGETVRSKLGIGIVYSVTTWRDRINDFDSDYEAQEFCAQCKADVGIGFQEDWCEVEVVIGSGRLVFQAKDLELVASRDYGEQDEQKRFVGFTSTSKDNIGGEQRVSTKSQRKKREEAAKKFSRA